MEQTTKKINPNIKLIYFLSCLFILISLFLIYRHIENYNNPIVCVKESKVVDILSLEGRSAKIQLENGQILELYGAVLNKGDFYCLNYARSKQ